LVVGFRANYLLKNIKNMLTNIREGLGKLFAILVLVLIAVTFVFFGVDLGLTTGTVAAKVNGDDISLYEFDQALRFREQQLALNNPGQITNDLRNQIRGEVVNSLVSDRVALQRSKELGFMVTDEAVADAIANQEQFRLGDQFSFDIYQSRLVGEGITAQYYESLQSDSLHLNALKNLFIDTSFLLPYEYNLIIGLMTERRRFGYAVFPTEALYDESMIPEESLRIYYDANSQNYATDLALDINLVEISADMFDESIDITESDILAYYEANSDRFISNEGRSASHILLPSGSTDLGQDLIARLANGDSFEDLAVEYSQDTLSAELGGDLGFISRGLFPSEFEDALFSLEVGTVSNLVETQFGIHIIRLDLIEEGSAQELDEVRSILLAEIQEGSAGTLFYEKASQLADLLYTNNADLQSIASSLELPIREVTNLTLESDQIVDPMILQNAFSAELQDGAISPIIELDDNRLAVMQVVNFRDPEPLAFDVVENQIRQQLARSEANRLAQIQAEAFLDDLQLAFDNQADIPMLAQESGASWFEPRWVSRDGELNDTPIELAESSFILEKPSVGSFVANITQLQDGASVVVILNDVEFGSADNLDPTIRQAYSYQLTELISAIEYESYLQQALSDATVNISNAAIAPVY
jgi:peptidyl-prolyl cis-trans isomerase D